MHLFQWNEIAGLLFLLGFGALILFLTRLSSAVSRGLMLLALFAYTGFLIGIGSYRALAAWQFVVFWAALSLERIWPRNRYSFFGRENLKSITVLPFREMALFLVSVWASYSLSQVAWKGIDLSRCPIWAQVPAFLLAADLLMYGIHRLQHRIPLYWRFHRLHHAVQELTATSNYRTHIIELALVQTGTRLLLVYWLGISVQAFVIGSLIAITIQGPLSHANLDFPRGRWKWLNSLIVTPNFHAVHHSLENPDTNFGDVFSFWDFLFGTFVSPTVPLSRFGIDDSDFTRKSVFSQHLDPIFPERVRMQGQV